jgi:hypothetical protein
VDEHCLLVVIFKSETGVGVVKYYAATAGKRIARQLKIARKRAPGEGLDLSMLNVAEPKPARFGLLYERRFLGNDGFWHNHFSF